MEFASNIASQEHPYPDGFVALLGEDKPLIVESGRQLSPFKIAYQTYGRLNQNRSNAVLICHALTGDQFVASQNRKTGREGWWLNIVGPEKAIDTNRYYVICSNVLGGCMGSSGPTEINKDGLVRGMAFPIVTISDMVAAQHRLIQSLGISKLLAVFGGSMGGMQVLEWLRQFPNSMNAAAVIASSYRNSAQNIAFNEVGRQAIVSDPDWHEGKYLQYNKRPVSGLAVARMLAHITYLSPEALHRKFGRRLQSKTDEVRLNPAFDMKLDFQVESYLEHQGSSFVDRFDANSYLYLSKAMDYFDLEAASGGDLVAAFTSGGARILMINFSSDWLFTLGEAKTLTDAMKVAQRDVQWEIFESEWGHDSFLLEHFAFENLLRKFLMESKPN